jgi:glycosyltransferase involved in cell wall biosynthesis
MNRKIRIMQVTNNLGIGGLERVIVNLCKHLNKNNFVISACCLSFKGAFAPELEDSGIPVFNLLNTSQGTNYFAFWKLKDIINQFKPDIIHTHNTNALFDGFLGAVISRVPVNIHTDHARKFPDKKRYMIAEWAISNFIDKIIAVSEETKTNLMRYEHISGDKIIIVNNGIDGTKYDITIDIDKKKKELGLEGFEFVIGLGVRLTEQKGITYLIKAAPYVLAKHPQTVFIIAGQGFLLDSLKDEARMLNLDRNFIFLGPRLDLPEILQVLDLYVLPSEWEGLPLVILEAMAAKKTIIATDVGGNSVAIINGQSGILVPPKNPQALAEQICLLIENKGKRYTLAQNAYERFYSMFEVKHMVREYEKIYEQTLETKGFI